MSQALNDLERVLSGAGVRDQKPVEKQVAASDPTKINETLEEIKNKLSGQTAQQGQQLQMLLSDPDIIKVLKAKQEGKPVQVLDEVKRISSEEQVTDQDLDDPKKLAKYLLQQTTQQIEQMIEQKMAPMKQDLIIRSQQEHVKQQAEFEKDFAAAKAQPDFEALIPTMRQLNIETNQTLKPNDLLILARARSAQLTPKGERVSTASERPTSEAVAPSRSEPFVAGPRGLEAALDRAYESVKSRRAAAT